jgi:hypothetical protein
MIYFSVNYGVVLRRLSSIAGLITVISVFHGMADTKPQRRRLTTQHHTQQPVTTQSPISTTPIQVIIPRPTSTKPPRPTSTTAPRHRSVTPQPTLLQHTAPRLPSTTPPEKWSTTRLRMFPKLTTPRLTSTTLLQRTTPGPPNITLHPTTHPQLRQYIFTTQRPLHPTTVIRITIPRFAVYYTKIYAAPSYYTEAPVYYNTEASEYYITTYASTPATIPKLRSISLLRVTTPLRHLNITSQLMPLQLTSRILKPILNFC